MTETPPETPRQRSPHFFSTAYAGLILDLIKVLRRLGHGELVEAFQAFHAEGIQELGEAEVRSFLFADWCRCSRERERMLEALAAIIAEAFAEAQADA